MPKQSRLELAIQYFLYFLLEHIGDAFLHTGGSNSSVFVGKI